MLSRRDFLKTGGLILVASAFAPYSPSNTDSFSAPILYHGSRRYRRIAITIDDCDLLTRLHMLEETLLANPRVRVTLFPKGTALLNNESKEAGIWKRFFGHGHEFGYHSFDHTNPGVLRTEKVIQDFDRWLEALYQVLDARPAVRFARPPYGVLSQSFLNMCTARGLVATMWSTGFGGPLEVGVHAAERVQNGDIVLMHTRQQPGQEDMAILAKVLPMLTERGVECVTISRLYADWLEEEINSPGCEAGEGQSLIRACLEG